MKIVLVRHGETEGNSKGLYEGKKEVSINDNGRNQSKKLGNLLKVYKFSKVYCSPQKRCKETLDIIIETLDYKPESIEYKDELKEIDFGLWEGLSYKEIEKVFPRQWEEFITNYKEFSFPEGESFIDFYKRTTKILDFLDDGSYLILTHGGVIRSVLSKLLGSGIGGFYSIKPKQGAYSEINYYKDFVEIEYINKD
ncbi:histidine phosphatase family protein [Clostridium intestinale]|uniref:histidine phosphatase family protein n=1 Tax=Clostridium intestinale TaxID=36845 RepID=UPI0028E98FC3|nr:histidine phosphatase family protein [Clostridium intestinale]